MHRRASVIALAAVLAVLNPPAAATRPILEMPHLFRPRPRVPQPSLVFAYRGWRIDASRAARAEPPARTVRAVRAQVDIVERLGLAPDTLTLMRTQPILADGANDVTAEPSDYVPGRGVVLHARRLDAKKPILLVALLKAYLAQRLPGGAANPEVTGLRAEAATRHDWPKTARMLQSNDDFFALNAAAYLYGAITREPYTRADLKKTEPRCYQWLAALFDHGRGRG